MKFKILGILFAILLIASFSFAAPPTVGDLILSNSYTNDLNYFTFPLDINALATGDVNAGDICWYTLTTGGALTPTTFDKDTNMCYLQGLTSAAGDDWNFSMSVTNSAEDANGISKVEYMWRDSNAPNTSASTIESSTTSATVTITSTDVATDIGGGSGVAATYYNVDGGDYGLYSSPLTISKIGSTIINFYANDNLDNNSFDSLGTTTVTLSGGGSVVCAVVNLIPILLFALAFIGANGLMAYKKGREGDIKMMVTFIIGLIIGVLILISIIPILC